MSKEFTAEAFGLPRAIALPRKSQLTGKQIQALVAPLVANTKKSGGEENPYTLIQLQGDGRNCNKCGYTSNCNGCALPIDDAAFDNGDGKESKATLALSWKDTGNYNFEGDKDVRDKSADVALAHKEDRIELADCIKAFNKQEILSEQDPWYCSDCKDFRQASKQMALYKLPNILIIHLKRFSYTRLWRDKLSALVDFPIDGLDMGPYCVNEDQKGDAVYDLYAVSNHMGGMGGGHYTAYCKNLYDGRWYCHDDSRVSRVNVNEIKSSSAYVLFYRKRPAKPTPGQPLPGSLTGFKDLPAASSTSSSSTAGQRSAAGSSATSLDASGDIEMGTPSGAAGARGGPGGGDLD